MIKKCRFYIECDSCGGGFQVGEDLETQNWVENRQKLREGRKKWLNYQIVKGEEPFTYWYILGKGFKHDIPKELHFCCKECANDYFKYRDIKHKYELIKFE